MQNFGAYFFTSSLGTLCLSDSLRWLSSTAWLARWNKKSGSTVEIFQKCSFLKRMATNVVTVGFRECLQGQRTFHIERNSRHLDLVPGIVVVIGVICSVISSSSSSGRCVGLLLRKPRTSMRNRRLVVTGVKSIMHCTLKIPVLIMISISYSNVSRTTSACRKSRSPGSHALSCVFSSVFLFRLFQELYRTKIVFVGGRSILLLRLFLFCILVVRTPPSPSCGRLSSRS